MENIEKRRRIEAESSLTELQVEYTNLIIQHELVKKALNNAERLLNEENSEEYFSDLSYSGLIILNLIVLFSL
jgi:predicted  nucleic acid-binding Zn-ribbon protein